MNEPCTLAFKACQRLFLELADIRPPSSFLNVLQSKGVLTVERVERVRGKTDAREQNKELIKALCENAGNNFPLVIESLGDTPAHRCLQENLSTTLSKIQASPALNLPDKKDIQLRLRLTRGRQRGADESHQLMVMVEEVMGRVVRGSAREALLIEYGLLVKSLEITVQTLDCQLQVNAKYNLIIRDVENGSMAQKIWSRLTQSSTEMGAYSDWSLSLQLPQVDKNLLTTLQTRQEDEEDPTEDPVTSHSASAASISDFHQGPILIPQSDLSEHQKVIWRLLLAHVTNKNYNLSQFYRVLRQCKLKANLMTLSSEDGFSLLHEVIRNKRGELTEAFQYCGLLLAMYSQPVGNAGNEYAGLTPVDLADRFGAVKERQEMEINMRIERNLQRYPIRIACRDGNVAQFRQLLRNDYPIGSANDNKSCLDWAIISGSLEMLNAVIEIERQRSHQREHGADQITLCVQLSHSNMLEPLLNHLQVDLNNIDIDGKSLTEKTSEYGDVEMFNVLKSRGANVQDTVLAIAAACGKHDFVLECINNHCPPLNINFRDRRQKTALHFATERGHVTVIELLVSRGADVTARDKRGRSFLHSAAENGNVEVLNLVVRLLQERNLFQNLLTTTDKHLGSELCFLVRGRDQEMPAWHYVHVDRGVLDIFRIKTRGGAVDVAQYGRVIKSGWGANPTQEVITEVESQFDMANISATAAPDMLPLHLAILKNNSDCAIRLIELMAESSINKPDCFGLTPLHYACMRGDIAVITALERKHASRSATDSKGRTPAQIATVNNHPEVIEYFRSDSLLGAVELLLQTNIAPIIDRLSMAELQRRVTNGENVQQYIRTVLRDLNSDINNFLYDELQSGPVMEESQTQH